MITTLIYKPRIAFMLFTVMAFSIISSCKKDEVKSDKIVLLSFGPTGAKHGDTLLFIGENLDKVAAIDLTGASIGKASFLSQSPERISIIIPSETEKGYVTLETPQGSITSKTQLNLFTTVVIKSITPNTRPGGNITITGEYLNWISGITFAKGQRTDSLDIVSQTFDKMVVTVPMAAQTGTLLISYGGTEPETIETETELIVTLPTITALSPNPVERGENLTITGTNLDLTKAVMFQGLSEADTVFVSKSATEIVIKVPDEANKGIISLITYSGIPIESAEPLTLVGDLPSLAPLGYAMYIDELEGTWQNWGWGCTVDFANVENVRDGLASIKAEYTGSWGALKFANGNVSADGYTEITFSIFGTEGTAGEKINISPSGGSAYTITLEEGKWVEYKLTMADVGNPVTIKTLTFQNQSWQGVVYIDHVGLR